MNEVCVDDGIINSVRSLSLSCLIDSLSCVENLGGYKNLPIYHRLVETLSSKVFSDEEEYYKCLHAATQIVYTLSLHGFGTNIQDKEGNTALLNYLSSCDYLFDDLVIAFLRCGADSCLKNKDGLDCLQYILQNDNLPKHIRARILEFMPGIWRAVDSDDAGTVRRLINQWCTIDIQKHGESVLQLAYSKGTENIIRVISGIGPSMNLAHAVLAGSIETVRRILTSNVPVNVNLKNMSDRGSTPVYYAICYNDQPMVELLLKHGARLDVSMKGEDECELPLYFAVLSHTPAVNVQIAQLTIPYKPVPVHSLYYKGRNVIFYCIEHNVDVELFEDILRTSSAFVLTQRVENNLDARQYAVVYGKQKYVSKIDQVVFEWCLQDEHVLNRNILCLHGYQFILPITAEKSEECDKWTQFLELYQEFEEFKQKLKDATEAGDAECVREMLECKSWSQRGLGVCLADCRVLKDGQPLLHKAVLREHYDVVNELANYMVYSANRKLDTIRDQYFRTALHYTYGMRNGKILITTLEDLGMSEYVMDKDGRSPLAFKDRRDLKEMEDLLTYHLIQDLSQPEPDPWSVCLPLPITGFLKTCLHDHRKKKEKRLYDKIDKSVCASPRNASLEHNSNMSVLDNKEGLTTKEGMDCAYNSYSDYGTSIIQKCTHIDKNDTNFHDSNTSKFSNKQNPATLKDYRSCATEPESYGSSLGSLSYSERYSQNYDDDSELSSDEDYTYNDYEGDQSEVESENEEEKMLQDSHCLIL